MPRAAFDTTADIYYGPRGLIPGGLKATVNARYVVEDGVFLAGANTPVRPAYLTHDGAAADGAWTPGTFGADARLADQVAIPAGAAPSHWILFEERIDWLTQATYWRSNLIPLPLPVPAIPAPIAGGNTAAAATPINALQTYVVNLPAGTTQWFWVPFIGPNGYAVNVDGLTGAATLTTYEGPSGALTIEIPPSGNGTPCIDPSGSTDPKKFIAIAADPSLGSIVTFTFAGTTSFAGPPPAPGGTCLTAGAIALSQMSGTFTITDSIDAWWIVPAGAASVNIWVIANPDGATGQLDVYSGACGSLTLEAATGFFAGGPQVASCPPTATVVHISCAGVPPPFSMDVEIRFDP